LTTTGIDIEMLTEMLDQGIISQEDFDAQMATASLAPHTEPEEIEIELGDEQISRIEGVIEATEHREAAYASQESTVTVDSIVEATPGAPVEAPKRDKKASGTPKAPKAPSTGGGKRVARATSAGSMGAWVSGLASTIELVDGEDPVDTIGLIDGIAAKKVQEKAVGLATHFINGSKLSVYTRIGFDVLVRDGNLSSNNLVKAFQAGVDGKPYSLGTARSQAQQIVSILRLFRVIDDKGEPVEGSTYLRRYRGALAA